MIENPTNDDINYFARTNFRNKEQTFGIRRDDRRRHMYIIGKTGVGKTTLLENLAINDIKAGEGLAYFDPHGESVMKLLDFIPNDRINDVVYFNPHDTDFPIGFNILEVRDPSEKHLVASGLMSVFTKLWANVWSARMEHILNNTVRALLDTPGQTLLGIARMYTDKKYRAKIVANIKDPVVKSFWEGEFPNYSDKLRADALVPIQNKVGQFLSSAIIRNIVAQTKSTIDFREIMDNGKILLVNLSKGQIGEDASALLGAMMITKLQLAAMSRIDVPEHDRRDFFLYVDEFQNFATESFATILSEARKYRLDLTIAHQYIAQLFDAKTRTAPVRDAVFGNVGTIVAFRVGAEDAEFLEKEFEPVFEANDLVNLSKAHIYLKLMINGIASTPFSAVTLPPISERTDNADKVIKVSRERYGIDRETIEKKIFKWLDVEYFSDVGKTATIDAEDEGEEELRAARAPSPSLQAMKPVESKPLSRPQPKPFAPAQKAAPKPIVPPKPKSPVQAEYRPKPQPVGSKNVWEKAAQIQEKKSTASVDDLMEKLMGAIDQADLKPQKIERPAKQQRDDILSQVVKEDSTDINIQEEITHSVPPVSEEMPKDRRLQPGERVKF